jgi:hypothetical protein
MATGIISISECRMFNGMNPSADVPCGWLRNNMTAKYFRTMLRLYAAFLICCLNSAALLNAQEPQSSSELATLPVILPVVDCEKLPALDISAAVGYPTHISSAKIVQNSQTAAYCDVLGYVEPAVQFEVTLPLQNWKQRFLQSGCVAICGMYNITPQTLSRFFATTIERCTLGQNDELVVSSTDMGHEGGMDGAFGASDYQLRVDFAYRGQHVTALATKAIIEKFYGQQPKYSYFSGCSDGGREALMEAQRFPEDFDGIIAGAPAMNFSSLNSFYHGWNYVMNTDDSGNTIFPPDKLPLLHNAVLDACDALDGLKDGLVGNPWACRFDPGILSCKPGQNEFGCLTAEQVNVVREIYAGAHDKEGNKLVMGGPLYGAELSWEGPISPQKGEKSMGATFALGSYKNLLHMVNPPADFKLKDMKFDRESFKDMTQLHYLYDATDPDLSPFFKAGHKLIMWHGTSDADISVMNSIAYYTAMQAIIGKDKVEKSSRLYLLPGVGHCGYGEGPSHVDWLTALMSWVEKSKAPGRLIAKHTTSTPKPDDVGSPLGKVDHTRPVYPYPYVAKYIGYGSIDDEKNFIKGEAQPMPAEKLEWLGKDLFTPRYEKWCTGKGTTLTCKDSKD